MTGQSIAADEEDEIRAAAIQLNSTAERAKNLQVAERLVREAGSMGAELVVLPEKWNLLAEGEALAAGAEPIDGPSIESARSWARELGIDLVAGSFAERVAGSERVFNTSLHITADGDIAASYRKIHMFDVDVDGVAYRESEREQPGDEIVTTEVGGVRVGMTVCYDLRFPELYRILAVRGACVLTVPSAFTAATGRDHWHVLVRARAIENQAFVIAANQWGTAPPHFSSYGHSLIVDPWGRVLAESPEGDCVIHADLDFEELERVRRDLPSLANRQPGAYSWPQAMGVS